MIFFKKLLAVFVLVHKATNTLGGHGDDWSYFKAKGPKVWGKTYPHCNENGQSPINFPPVCGMVYNDSLGEITLNGFDVPDTYKIKNNGHTVQLDIVGGMTVFGGGLASEYRAIQLHFHWGSEDNFGSEHTYNGKRYPLEMHIVTYSMKYSDLLAAVDKPDGLAVLGFWFEISDTDNEAYTSLLESLSDIKDEGTSNEVTYLEIESLLPRTMQKFYRYHGSLTTPPCYESVTWTMFEQRIQISSAQLESFRSINQNELGTHRLMFNYRPVQPLNSRKVYVNYPPEQSVDFRVCEIDLS